MTSIYDSIRRQFTEDLEEDWLDELRENCGLSCEAVLRRLEALPGRSGAPKAAIASKCVLREGGDWRFCYELLPVPLETIMARQGFVNPRVTSRLPDSKHVFTHRVWRMQGWLAECDSPPEGFTPVDAAALAALPFPSALRVYREIAGEILE